MASSTSSILIPTSSSLPSIADQSSFSSLGQGNTETSITSSTSTTTTIPKGQNVSGRTWKCQIQKRASSLIKTKYNNQSTTWERKQQQRYDKQLSRDIQKEMIQAKKEGIVQKKERQLENTKRRAENELRVIQKSAQQLNVKKLGTTIKAMSKKQLRAIKKTRLNTKTGVVEYVPMYSK